MMVRIEMQVPDTLDPSEILDRMQGIAIDWYEEETGRDVGPKLAESITNDVSVQLLPREDGRPWHVADRVTLTRDCELGQEGAILVVTEADGPYMTISPEGNPSVRIHTGRDYRYLTRAE